MDVEIEGVRVDVKPQWRQNIEARVADLHPGQEVTHVRVRLLTHDHRKPDDSHSVLVVVQIPGHTITAEKQQATFEGAIEEAFDAAVLELDKLREKRASHTVDVSAPPERGVVTKLFIGEGYGFITLEDTRQVYFHKNAVRGLTFEEMDGLSVSLNIEPGEKGPQATVVEPLPPEAYYIDKRSAA